MIKPFQLPTAATLLVAATMVMPGTLSAAGFVLTCETLDSQTQNLKNSFTAGGEMLLRLVLQVPPAAAQKEVSVKLTAHFKVGSVTIPYTLDELKISLPNKDPAVDTGSTKLPWSGNRAESRLVKIPQNFPAGTYNLRAKATIEGVGKQACEIEVGIAAK